MSTITARHSNTHHKSYITTALNRLITSARITENLPLGHRTIEFDTYLSNKSMHPSTNHSIILYSNC